MAKPNMKWNQLVDFAKPPGTRTARKPLDKEIPSALKKGLEVGGLKAKIKVEQIKGTKLFRVEVISSQFAALRPSERQDLVWRILGEELSREERFHISRVSTFTPDELAGKWSD
jgi:stress-induced morphogen